jgi:hypothetical protein
MLVLIDDLSTLFILSKHMLVLIIFSLCQVKSYWLNSDGADVINHMMDHFII